MLRLLATMLLAATVSATCAGCGIGPAPAVPLDKHPPLLRGFSASVGFGLPESNDGAWTIYSSAAGGSINLLGQLDNPPPGTATPATTFSWDMGAGFSPNTFTSTFSESGGKVLALAPGTYACSVTATNAYGSSTYHFTATVLQPPPPTISAPSGFEVATGATTGVYLYVPTDNGANYEYGPTFSWHWDFGGGCTPNSGSEPAATVTAGAPGNYILHVTVSNPAGSDSYDQPYSVYAPTH